MAGGDINAWRKQNSDAVPIVVVLGDGTQLRGTTLLPRDKSLREHLSQPEPFLDVEGEDGATMLIAKSMLRYVQPIEMPRADQLERRLKLLDKMEVPTILKIARGADLAAAETAAARQREIYDPARLAATDSAPEVVEYVATVRRRIDLALAEYAKALDAQAKAEAKLMAAAAVPARKVLPAA